MSAFTTSIAIGDESVDVTQHGPDAETGLAFQRSLPLGAVRTARDCFRHTPPNALEIETAIMVVEDEVMPLRAQLAGGSALCSSDAGVAQIALLAGVSPGDSLSLDALERVFNRLADVASGAPVASSGLPADPAFAARLVILREFMHHAGFDAIRLVKS